MNKMKIRKPDNWHAHPRQGDLLARVFHHFNIYGRVLCIGNTSPLIETADDALRHKKDILAQGALFEPVMCIMLTQDTTPKMIFEAAEKGIKFVKFIPVGTSTGATKGLRLDDLDKLYKIFPTIEETGMYLPLHAELMSSINGREIHLLDREEAAINIVSAFHKRFPGLKITIEHVSTAKMINFVQSQDSANVRATLTPQHAILTYDDVFDHNDRLINPYNYCLPVAKKEIDRQAVIAAMVSGDERFFAGADSAPHWAKLKAGDNPPAGIFFGPAEFPMWVEIFERQGALSKLENFTSRFGAEYYGYPLNSDTITLVQEEWELPVIENGIRYCKGGEKIRWKVIKNKTS